MAFAYQGFGLGEFYKAQQKLQEILEACFLGVFDAPTNYLSLARTLEGLADRIERLFDENGNPNSSILRADNKPLAQQMLRIASHGLIESLNHLERVISVEEARRDPDDMRGHNVVYKLSMHGEETVLGVLTEKFRFQTWKLDLFFKVLRKSKVSQTLSVYDGVQRRLGKHFEELAARKSTASYSTTSSYGGTDSSGIQEIDIIQRFQDACEFGGGGHNFIWKLKPESTLLITLHWVFNLNRNNDPKKLPVEAYVNLMKCSWLLRVTTPDAGVEGFSDEVRTMIGLLGCDVVYRLQEYFDQEVEPPTPQELMERGDFNIFIDGINKKDIGAGLVRTAVPTAFPGVEPDPPLRLPLQIGCGDFHMLNSPFDRFFPVDESGSSKTSMRANSMDIDKRQLPELSMALAEQRGGPSRSMSASPYVVGGRDFRNGCSSGPPSLHSASNSISSIGNARIGHIGVGYSPEFFNTTQCIGQPHSRPSTSGTSGPPAPRKFKPNYSWNEIVDRENLGVRPGEVEILPKDFELMHLMASYTGDRHGRWDNCRVRIFKLMSDKTLRILTLMDGLEESIDQRVAYVKEAELVPDYGYHQNHPIIYIRKTHKQDPFLHGNPRKIAGKPMPPSSLYYKFRNAHDMFNFQFALLGEAVETDFQAVRTVRFKKSLRDGEHSHYKARIQLWREVDDDTEVLASVPSVAPTATRDAWALPNLKVHTTRMVMYWDETITTFFVTDSIDIDIRHQRRCSLRVRPSSHKTFQNPTSVKARTFGSRESPGGFRLDKKGLFPDDEESFEDFKWFEIEFNNQEEMNNFFNEFKKALNLRRRERWQIDELKRLAARGVPAGAEVMVTPSQAVRR